MSGGGQDWGAAAHSLRATCSSDGNKQALAHKHWQIGTGWRVAVTCTGRRLVHSATKQPAAKPKETAGEYLQRVDRELLATILVRSGGRPTWRWLVAWINVALQARHANVLAGATCMQAQACDANEAYSQRTEAAWEYFRRTKGDGFQVGSS